MSKSVTTYLSGSTVILAGTSVGVTLPTNVRLFSIRAEGDSVYYEINASSGSASNTSPGYVPIDTVELSFNIYNINTLHLYGSGSSKAHIQYFG